MSLIWLLIVSNIASFTMVLTERQSSLISVNNCEANISVLYDASRSANQDTVLLAVGRLGDGEYHRGLNRRRLHNVKLYWKEFCGQSPDKIIIAEGERITGKGRVEIYINGKLLYTIKVNLGEDFYAGSCDGTSSKDKLFFDSRKPKR
jgi:hypothetical protein